MITKELRKNKGITLIALIITVIILLILAGITIRAITGDDGIIGNVEQAKEETRGASVEEARDLWKLNQEVDEDMEKETAQTLNELLSNLRNQQLLTDEEVLEVKETGKTTIGNRTIIFLDISPISDVVKIGDFVNYEAGEWKKDEIDELGTFYSGVDLPTKAFKFGGFKEGDSKDISIDVPEGGLNKYSYGWRVLKVDKDTNTVQLIHSGTPEGYFSRWGNGEGFQSYYILTGKNYIGQSYGGSYRKWSAYENLDYAIAGSSRMAAAEDVKLDRVWDLIHPCEKYWLAGISDSMGFSTEICWDRGNMSSGDMCLGVRPVVTLKSSLMINCSNSSLDGSSPDKAYVLFNNE